MSVDPVEVDYSFLDDDDEPSLSEEQRVLALLSIIGATKLGVTTLTNDGRVTWTYQPISAPVPDDPTGEQDQ